MSLRNECKILLEAISKTFNEKFELNENKIMTDIRELKDVNQQLQNRCTQLEKVHFVENETKLLLIKKLYSNKIIIHETDATATEDSNLEKSVLDLLNSKLKINIKEADLQQT